MRIINSNDIAEVVKGMCIKANCHINKDIKSALSNSVKTEKSDISKGVIENLLKNAEIADSKEVPICQDTGMAVVFLKVGQDVHFVGGDLYEAIHAGVAHGYTTGYLRKSSVGDPLFDRKNSNDNTPAIIHTKIVPGDKVKFIVLPKGCGSENMGAIKMLKPADGVEGVKKFVVDTVRAAGPNPCPPITVGVGIGGNMEQATLLAKHSLTRTMGEHNADPRYAKLEEELLELVNKTGVGPSGLGGRTTALAVNVEFTHTHIGGLPCAVNLNCHAARCAEAEL